jgi:hypothetical protein
MALKALIDGEEIQSWRCSEERWKNLVIASRKKQVKVTMCCCGARGIPRKGSRRPHFAHFRRSDNCNYNDESKEHEEAKSIIAQACLDAGWEVDTEVSGPGYEADVMATRDDKKVAFEVQLSYQTKDVTEERRSKFESDNVKDFWLFRKMPASCDGRKPRFHVIEIKGDAYSVKHWERELPLEEFVKRALIKEDERWEYVGYYNASDEPNSFWYNFIDWLCKYWPYIVGVILVVYVIRKISRRK